MRRNRLAPALLLSATLGLSPIALAACGSESADDTATIELTETGGEAEESEATEDAQSSTTLEDGTYEIEATTDSSMFHAAHCTLEVTDGAMVAHLALPGEGFSRLFYGTAEEAEAAASTDDAKIYDYYLGEDGLYTFDVPVPALDEELTIAAFGQRRDTWYDHTIAFASPAGDAS